MKLVDEVSNDKLRGGYYTAAPLVDWCVDRVTQLAHVASQPGPRRWLEPAAGDGAFIHGLGRLRTRCGLGDARLDAIELVASEAAACETALRESGLSGTVVNDSFFAWARRQDSRFDALVGNPPYVRYQFVGVDDRKQAEELTAALGIDLRGVSNLWIPFALVGLSLLRPGGAFALVLPNELFCTISAGQFRSTVIRDFTNLRIDLFPRETFPSILQDVVVVSGLRAERQAAERTVAFCEHRPSGDVRWQHAIDVSQQSWQRYLLSADEANAFKRACALPGITQLGSVARIEVSIVTGANPFFTIDESTVEAFSLATWARPLLARTADAPGIVFGLDDHARARERGSRAWLLDFSAERPEPSRHSRARTYLAGGEAKGLDQRYKCRIRSPWYRVPQIRRGRLMMPKRAHHHHRLLLNRAGVFTTDTVYRGYMHGLYASFEEDLVSGFQSTLTLLSAEVEGRTYGGGVLELVPSEIARLRVPVVSTSSLLPELDTLSRLNGGQRDGKEAVVARTDAVLGSRVTGYAELLPTLREARRRLVGRRMDIH